MLAHYIFAVISMRQFYVYISNNLTLFCTVLAAPQPWPLHVYRLHQQHQAAALRLPHSGRYCRTCLKCLYYVGLFYSLTDYWHFTKKPVQAISIINVDTILNSLI